MATEADVKDTSTSDDSGISKQSNTLLYISTVAATGKIFDELIGKLLDMDPNSLSWKRLTDTIDLKTYFTSTSLGNYVVSSYTNGPTGTNGTDPLNIEVKRLSFTGIDTTYMITTYNEKTYIRNCTSTSSEWEVVSLNDLGLSSVSFVKSTTAPSNTDAIWVDNTNPDIFVLKYYNAGTNKWVDIVYDDTMLLSTYDSSNKLSDNIDISSLISDMQDELNTNTDRLFNHIDNKGKLIHVTAEQREALDNNYLTTDDINSKLDTTYQDTVKAKIDTKLSNATDLGNLQSKVDGANDNYNAHLNGHITADMVSTWDSKADANHTHGTSDNVTINASDITSGTFTLSQLPPEIQERAYQITALSDLASSSITDTDRKNKYHNGNTLYIKATSSSEDDAFYKIIDQTKIGTSSYMDGLLEFKQNTPKTLDWSYITSKPNTIAGYGITDLYSKTEVDNAISNTKYTNTVASANTRIDAYNTYKTITLNEDTMDLEDGIAAIGLWVNNSTTVKSAMNTSIKLGFVLLLDNGNVLATDFLSNPDEDNFDNLDYDFHFTYTETSYASMFNDGTSAITANKSNSNWTSKGYGVSLLTNGSLHNDTVTFYDNTTMTIGINADSDGNVEIQLISPLYLLNDASEIMDRQKYDREDFINDVLVELYGEQSDYSQYK
jgi:hypothetical protein